MSNEIKINEKNILITPSVSKYVVERLLNIIDFEKAKVIVGYGLSNGTITQLLQLMKGDTILFAIGTNDEIFNALSKIQKKHIVIISSDVEKAK